MLAILLNYLYALFLKLIEKKLTRILEMQG